MGSTMIPKSLGRTSTSYIFTTKNFKSYKVSDSVSSRSDKACVILSSSTFENKQGPTEKNIFKCNNQCEIFN